MITILDDEPARIEEMLHVLAAIGYQKEVRVFDNAPAMTRELPSMLPRLELICLDHDLGPNRRNGDIVFDPGVGRDVADYLAAHSACCPVLIHTTNSLAAPGMRRVLEESGWPIARVIPHDDLEWITTDWQDEVKRLLHLPR